VTIDSTQREETVGKRYWRRSSQKVVTRKLTSESRKHAVDSREEQAASRAHRTDGRGQWAEGSGNADLCEFLRIGDGGGTADEHRVRAITEGERRGRGGGGGGGQAV
jgi:hypothetical protein